MDVIESSQIRSVYEAFRPSWIHSSDSDYFSGHFRSDAVGQHLARLSDTQKEQSDGHQPIALIEERTEIDGCGSLFL